MCVCMDENGSLSFMHPQKPKAKSKRKCISGKPTSKQKSSGKAQKDGIRVLKHGNEGVHEAFSYLAFTAKAAALYQAAAAIAPGSGTVASIAADT